MSWLSAIGLMSGTSYDGVDVALICTDHDGVDYRGVVEHCPLVIDTRNACAHAGASAGNVVKA